MAASKKDSAPLPAVRTVGQLLEVVEQGRWLDRNGLPLVQVSGNDIDAFQTVLAQLWDRHGHGFRNVESFKRMIGCVAVHHRRTLPDVRRLEFKEFLALLQEVPEYRASARGSPPRGGRPKLALKRGDKEILHALADAFPQTMTIEQIQAAIQRTRGRLSDKPIRERLKVFRKAKLVEQPRGPRGGHSITDAGKALVNRATG